MLRTLCCVALLLGWPLSAQASGDTEIFYEHHYRQQTQQAYNIGIAHNDAYSPTHVGLMLTHIPNYSADPLYPDYNMPFLYIGAHTPGTVSFFYDAGIDLWTIIATAINASMEDSFCDDSELYYDDCWASDFIELHPNVFLTLGIKLNSRAGNLAMFWRYYWLDNGLEYGRRYLLGVRYSLRF